MTPIVLENENPPTFDRDDRVSFFAFIHIGGDEIVLDICLGIGRTGILVIAGISSTKADAEANGQCNDDGSNDGKYGLLVHHFRNH